MIETPKLLAALRGRGIQFYCGVPDSLLAPFCAHVEELGREGVIRHVITANEGNAVAVAMGYHLATGAVPLVYMQNSGLGNAVNPLASLAHADVYRVPMVLMIGWRGEPGIHDEPQHIHQGRMTLAQLEALDIPYAVIDATTDVDTVLDSLWGGEAPGSPVALVMRKDALRSYARTLSEPALSPLTRESAIDAVLNLAQGNELFVSTTGKASRELFECRRRRGEPQRDFLTVGGMGHTASIALGVAMAAPKRRVVCLDGDGSMLMHMGSLPVIASQRPHNLVHIVLNNGAHESVGGQPTVARELDIPAMARASGYEAAWSVSSLEELQRAWGAASAHRSGPVLMEVRLSCSSRADLGRPTSSAEANKRAFMDAVRGVG